MTATSKAYNLLHDDNYLEGLKSTATAYSIRYSANSVWSEHEANINLCIIEEISSIEILDNNILAVTFFHVKNQNIKGDVGSPLNIQARALINHWWRLLQWLCPTTVQSWPDLSLWAMEVPKHYFPLNVISESGSSHNGWPSSFWISSGVHLSRGRKSTMLRG